MGDYGRAKVCGEQWSAQFPNGTCNVHGGRARRTTPGKRVDCIGPIKERACGGAKRGVCGAFPPCNYTNIRIVRTRSAAGQHNSCTGQRYLRCWELSSGGTAAAWPCVGRKQRPARRPLNDARPAGALEYASK